MIDLLRLDLGKYSSPEDQSSLWSKDALVYSSIGSLSCEKIPCRGKPRPLAQIIWTIVESTCEAARLKEAAF